MGDDVREQLSGKVAELFQHLDEGLTTVTMFWRDAPTPAHARRDKARLEMCELFSNIIKERREHPDVKHEDALQSFMDQKYKDGRKLRFDIFFFSLFLVFFSSYFSSSSYDYISTLLTPSPQGRGVGRYDDCYVVRWTTHFLCDLFLDRFVLVEIPSIFEEGVGGAKREHRQVWRRFDLRSPQRHAFLARLYQGGPPYPPPHHLLDEKVDGRHEDLRFRRPHR